MKILIKNFQNKSIDISKLFNDFSYSISLADIFETVTLKIPYFLLKDYNIQAFNKVIASKKGLDFKGIILHIEINNLKTVNLTIVSNSFYLSTYEDIIKLNNFNAKRGIEQVLKNFDSELNLKCIPLQNNITKIYKDNSIIDIIDDIISTSESFLSSKIYRVFEKDTLTIFTKATPYKKNFTNLISDLRLAYDGEDIKTKVKVFTEEKNKITVACEEKNSNLIRKVGLIQKTHKLKAENVPQAKHIAKNLLKIYGKVKKSVSFTTLGDFNIKIGKSIEIENDNFLINQIEHTFKEKNHLTKIKAETYE